MKKILIVSTFNNHFRFFKRLAEPLQKLNYEVHFLTNRYSIVRESGIFREKVYSLKNQKEKRKLNIDLENSFEIAAGLISVSKAEKLVNSVWLKVEELWKAHKYEYFFMWSGVRLIEFVINEFAKEKNVRTLFFELGNFPRKLFVDPDGTNAKSLLAKNSSILNQFDYSMYQFENWRNEYIEKSLSVHEVPQGSTSASVDYKKNIIDTIGFRFHNFIQYEPLITKEKLIGKYLRRLVKIDYDQVDLEMDEYIFYPMQVNKDAQLILNSEVGNLEALQNAVDIAKSKSKKLLVKPHPAEVEIGFMTKVKHLKEELDFYIVDNNTMQLIYYSNEVVTINSTVGLQAKLFGKPVTCLGKAFYSDFTDEDLARYLGSYLIEVDFWNESQIDISTADEIISRTNIKQV